MYPSNGWMIFSFAPWAWRRYGAFSDPKAQFASSNRCSVMLHVVVLFWLPLLAGCHTSKRVGEPTFQYCIPQCGAANDFLIKNYQTLLIDRDHVKNNDANAACLMNVCNFDCWCQAWVCGVCRRLAGGRQSSDPFWSWRSTYWTMLNLYQKCKQVTLPKHQCRARRSSATAWPWTEALPPLRQRLACLSYGRLWEVLEASWEKLHWLARHGRTIQWPFDTLLAF